MTKATFIKGSIYLGMAYSFRGSVLIIKAGNMAAVRADMVPETNLRVIYLDLKALGEKLLFSTVRVHST